jgi:hypothetical protein
LKTYQSRTAAGRIERVQLKRRGDHQLEWAFGKAREEERKGVGLMEGYGPLQLVRKQRTKRREKEGGLWKDTVRSAC